jgi:outer membrane protein assembly factor BamB
MTLRFGAFLSVALLPHPSAQNDWPAYGHDSGVGGLTATGGGIVLIAATNDARLRAFDSRTGKELWTGRLNTSGKRDAGHLPGQGRSTVRSDRRRR